jgi:hypothetical protein
VAERIAPERISFRPVAAPAVPWDELDRAPDRVICQTRGWLDFLAETQDADAVIAQVLVDGEVAGWFTGATVRKAGVKILGSPMRGWTTAAMGFNLGPDLEARDALRALPAFAFGELGCLHLELGDRHLDPDAPAPEGFAIAHLRGFELALVDDADEQLAAMKSYGRRDVRRALRNGIVVEEVDPAAPGDFAERYYDQVSEAFAKRDLVPTYPVERVEALIRTLGPTGNLLLLQASTPEGEPAATGIFPGLSGATAEYWMGGSYRRHQALLPNEALMWTALRTWRDRGAERFNFGGGGKYKAKYGGEAHAMAWVRRSRFEVLERARGMAFDLYRRRQRRASSS